jgi:UrcA family protein
MTRFNRLTTALLAAGLTTGSLLAATTASAAERISTPNGIAVRYSPNELTNSYATEKLYRNLKLAAREACGDGPTLRSLTERIQEERCVDQVLASVVQKINQPMLTSLHESRLGKVG